MKCRMQENLMTFARNTFKKRSSFYLKFRLRVIWGDFIFSVVDVYTLRTLSTSQKENKSFSKEVSWYNHVINAK